MQSLSPLPGFPLLCTFRNPRDVLFPPKQSWDALAATCGEQNPCLHLLDCGEGRLLMTGTTPTSSPPTYHFSSRAQCRLKVLCVSQGWCLLVAPLMLFPQAVPQDGRLFTLHCHPTGAGTHCRNPLPGYSASVTVPF